MADDKRKGRSTRMIRCENCGAIIGLNIPERHDNRCPFCGHKMKRTV